MDYLARCWVIVRFNCENPDALDAQQLKMKKKFESLGKKYAPFYNRREKMIMDIEKYFFIISLLLERGDFSRIPRFLMTDLIKEEFDLSSWPAFAKTLYVNSFAHSDKTMNYSRIYTFDEIVNHLNIFCTQMEPLLLKEYEKIMYIGELVQIVNFKMTDTMVQFNSLVSIIEMLVTHSPDYTRFNVEESISKQFILKTSILIYQHDKNETLEYLKNNLKVIYNIRSKIAHGDLVALNEYYKKNSDEDELSFFLYLWVLKLNKYIKSLLIVYLSDPEYVNFIKKN